MIDAVTGKVSLKKSLLGAENERYEVSVGLELDIRGTCQWIMRGYTWE